MPSLILPSTLTQQPQQPAPLSALGSRLKFQTLFVGGTNTATGARFKATQTVTSKGIGAVVALASAEVIPLGIPVAASWSLVMVVRRDTQVNFPYFIGVALSAGAVSFALAGQHSNIGNRMGWYDGAGFQDSGFVQALGSTDVIGLTFDGATNRYSWYKNGRAYNTTIGPNNGGSGLWQFAAVSGEPTTNTLPLLAIASRAASAPDMLALTANPWQIMAAPPRRLWAASTSSGPASYNYSATGGIVLTGAAPVQRAAIRATTGGIQLSGIASHLRGAARTSASGIALGGAATSIRGRMRLAAGGVLLAGAAAIATSSVVQSFVASPAGGMVLRGAAVVARRVSYVASGGITFAGRAATATGPILTLLANLLPALRRRRR